MHLGTKCIWGVSHTKGRRDGWAGNGKWILGSFLVATQQSGLNSFLMPEFTYDEDPVSCEVNNETWHDFGA